MVGLSELNTGKPVRHCHCSTLKFPKVRVNTLEPVLFRKTFGVKEVTSVYTPVNIMIVSVNLFLNDS